MTATIARANTGLHDTDSRQTLAYRPFDHARIAHTIADVLRADGVDPSASIRHEIERRFRFTGRGGMPIKLPRSLLATVRHQLATRAAKGLLC